MPELTLESLNKRLERLEQIVRGWDEPISIPFCVCGTAENDLPCDVPKTSHVSDSKATPFNSNSPN
jgi:hypothetical protein